jgi:hypothetical protein
MNRITPLSGALLTAGYLFGGFAIGVGIGGVVGTPGHSTLAIARNVVAGVIALTCMIAGGRLWGRELALRVGADDVRRASRAGALSFGPGALVAALVLTVLEGLVVQQQRGHSLPIHVVYGFLFVPAVFFVASSAVLVLGAGLRIDKNRRWRLALTCGIAAAAAHLVVYRMMDRAGWRIGAPDAARRATMIVVTSLGALAAALAGGATLGYFLSRVARQENS